MPVFQRFDLLGKCLDAIPEAVDDIEYDITIFDNGSPKEVADEFYGSRTDKNLKVIRSKDNLGFPIACNRGAGQGFAPLIFFLNDDVILEKGSVNRLVRVMDDPSIGIAGMRLMFPEATDLTQNNFQRPAGKVQHVGLETNIRAELYHIFLGWSGDNPKVKATKKVYAVTGAALMIRRALWTKIGGFNSIYGTGTYKHIKIPLIHKIISDRCNILIVGNRNDRKIVPMLLTTITKPKHLHFMS